METKDGETGSVRVEEEGSQDEVETGGGVKGGKTALHPGHA